MRLHAPGHKLRKLSQVLLRWRDHPDRLSRTSSIYSREAFNRVCADYLSRDPRVSGGRPIVVWGAGRRTRQRARLIGERGVEISAWIDIDRRKIGQRYDGIPTHPPSWLEGQRKPLVLVYVTSRGAREQIDRQLIAMGYREGEDYLGVG